MVFVIFKYVARYAASKQAKKTSIFPQQYKTSLQYIQQLQMCKIYRCPVFSTLPDSAVVQSDNAVWTGVKDILTL